jgi:hypothetical protein
MRGFMTFKYKFNGGRYKIKYWDILCHIHPVLGNDR